MADFEVSEILHESEKTQIYRAKRRSYGHIVSLKIRKPGFGFWRRCWQKRTREKGWITEAL